MQTVKTSMWSVSNEVCCALCMVILVPAVLGCQDEGNKHVAPVHSVVTPARDLSIVDLQIDMKIDTSDGHVIVRVTWKNFSATDTCFFEPWQLFQTPLMEGGLLQISESGRRVHFLGAMVKRKAFGEKDLVRLAPGQSLQGQQDITTQYGFAPGTHVYSVIYSAFLQAGSPRTYQTVSSEPLIFTLVR